MIENYKFQSDLALRQIGAAAAKSRRAGLREGERLGQKQGSIRSLQEAAIELARSKLGVTSRSAGSAIRTLRDAASLTALIVALGQASTPAAARTVIKQAAPRKR